VSFKAHIEVTRKVLIVRDMRSCSLVQEFRSSYTDKAGAGLEAHQHCQLYAGKVRWRYSIYENETKQSEHILRLYCRNVPGIAETKRNPNTA
jgi:hypothetical protein